MFLVTMICSSSWRWRRLRHQHRYAHRHPAFCSASRSAAISRTGYTYIMESMAQGEREVMGNRWQSMFAVVKS